MSTLAELICNVLDETSLVDPADVAREAFKRLAPEAYGPTLEHEMRAIASHKMTLHRRSAFSHPSEHSGNSPFVAAMQVAGRALRARVCVAGVWKLYGDCTEADLHTLAGEARQRAAELIGAAERHEKAAAAVAEHAAATLSAVPDSALTDLFGGTE